MRPDHNNAIHRVKPADGLWSAWSTSFFSTILQTEVTYSKRAKVPHSENTAPTPPPPTKKKLDDIHTGILLLQSKKHTVVVLKNTKLQVNSAQSSHVVSHPKMS
jgi:hypothetical protein